MTIGSQDLVWYPKSVTFIVNGKKYEGYKTPMNYFIATVIWSNLIKENN
jgi:hypothetical protein